ncbi:putative holin-like toxin [Metasolibacillus meyeri]
MTVYEAFSLMAQFTLMLLALLTFIVTIIVYLNKKK